VCLVVEGTVADGKKVTCIVFLIRFIPNIVLKLGQTYLLLRELLCILTNHARPSLEKSNLSSREEGLY